MGKIKGHILTEQELLATSQEYAINLLHAIAMNYPVKLITRDCLEEIPGVAEKFFLKETGAPVFTVSIEPLEIDRFNTVPEVKKILTKLCTDVLSYILQIWHIKHGRSPVYVLNGPSIVFQKKEGKLGVNIGLHLAGATTIEQANNEDSFKKRQDLAKNMPLVQQS